jgi:hypothetical protein
VFRFYEAAVRELRQSAITCRKICSSIAAIHFPACSEVVIDLRVFRFVAWQAGVQRLQIG